MLSLACLRRLRDYLMPGIFRLCKPVAMEKLMSFPQKSTQSCYKTYSCPIFRYTMYVNVTTVHCLQFVYSGLMSICIIFVSCSESDISGQHEDYNASYMCYFIACNLIICFTSSSPYPKNFDEGNNMVYLYLKISIRMTTGRRLCNHLAVENRQGIFCLWNRNISLFKYEK